VQFCCIFCVGSFLLHVLSVDSPQVYRDNMRKLQPEWVALRSKQALRVLSSTGNGNCLFNSVSILLCGSERLHAVLRLLAAAELIRQWERYLGPSTAALHPEVIRMHDLHYEEQVSVAFGYLLRFSSYR
jgi:hypothetical protein